LIYLADSCKRLFGLYIFSLQLAGAVVRVRNGSAAASVTNKSFQNMYSSAFVGKVSEERSAPAMAAGTFKFSTFVEQSEHLSQAVCVRKLTCQVDISKIEFSAIRHRTLINPYLWILHYLPVDFQGFMRILVTRKHLGNY